MSSINQSEVKFEYSRRFYFRTGFRIFYQATKGIAGNLKSKTKINPIVVWHVLKLWVNQLKSGIRYIIMGLWRKDI